MTGTGTGLVTGTMYKDSVGFTWDFIPTDEFCNHGIISKKNFFFSKFLEPELVFLRVEKLSNTKSFLGKRIVFAGVIGRLKLGLHVWV